jgi:hypothetical protein
VFRIPSFIHIYGKGAVENPDIDKISTYLKSLLPKSIVDVRTDFISNFLTSVPSQKTDDELDSIAKKLAEIRVLDPAKQELNPEPMYAEIDYEKRKILNPSTKSIGVFYDGFALQNVFHNLIERDEHSFAHIHIVFINQLIATWEDDDNRYHARSSVYGFPSIISTAGIVEAPAKPREFYLLKQQHGMMGSEDLAITEFKRKFEGRFIEYDDPHMSEVCKGYAAQALFYHITGEPFCQDKGCRLFNAHWQEELIYSQLKSPYEFCEAHTDMLKRLII